MFFDNNIVIYKTSNSVTVDFINRDKKVIRRNFFTWVFRLLILLIEIFVLLSLSSCKKVVEIEKPVDSITTQEAFSNVDAAVTAISGIYSRLINTQDAPDFGSSGITLFAGLSADEFIYKGTEFTQFYNNVLTSSDGYVKLNLWTPEYFAIFKANACIEGLTASSGVSEKVRNQLIGEAKFIRAFCFFYLANLYGDVPLTTTIDWEKNSPMARTSSDDVYKQIISDLTEAKYLMVSDYSFSNNERIRANKWAASALLARVYLYIGDYAKTVAEATSVIDNTSLYSLNTVADAFQKNGNEAILQFQPTNKFAPYAIPEASFLLPPFFTKNYPPNVVAQFWNQFVPKFALSNQLINAFEQDDQRKSLWIDSTGDLMGTNYYYPYKYKINKGTSGGNIGEYYTVLRLAEQYLIRAEAQARLNKISYAQNDLNTIRLRAGLPSTNANDQSSLFLAIEHERQVELFSEWGHRWFDLKRWKKANAVLAPIKGSNWQTTDQLFPIPLMELQKDPNLSQNPGY